ncbi:aminotransferase class I/II-fold pyridoxal phosphate-dependent enzyme [Candidatus Dojkabacteria bacterium]|nr:aminotransferase class I/II-fold pyridoxal phosphate-dependent enzyme [Candidatus Dojkabacteria bacterium]
MLAINGGKQAVVKKYQSYNHPQLSKAFYSKGRKEKWIDDVTTFDAPIISELQDLLCKQFGIKYTVVTNSGTSALFEMFYAAGLKEGDEVIIPVYTFFATATPLFVLGCRPIPADSTDNGNIDPEDIERKITSKTKAIVITHMWGIPCDMDEIMKISKKYNIPVLEDSSHAHGATYKEKVVGNFGAASAWSMGAKKLITGGQGGFFGTNNKDLYQIVTLLGHANNKRIKTITGKQYIPYSTTGTGLNLRMHPYSASAIMDQLKIYSRTFKQRQEVAEYLIKEIEKIEGISLPRLPEKSVPAWYSFTMFYDKKAFNNLDIHKFVEALQAEGAYEFDIPNSTCPLTEFQIFRDGAVNIEGAKIKEKFTKKDFPNAYEYKSKMFKIPVWYGKDRLKFAEQYIKALKKVAKHYKEIK